HRQHYNTISSDDSSACTSNPDVDWSERASNPDVESSACTSNPDVDCPACTSNPNVDCPACTSNSSNGCSNCTPGWFTIVPVSADYVSFKKSSNPLFNDLFNFANESGFTKCIAKYLVYKQNTSEFIGFMGLRVNEDFTDKIALFSFENSSLDTVLVQFSISSENITTFSVFDRSSGIEISNRTVISSYGAFESLENIEWKTILLIDDLVGFLNYRFNTVKCEFEGLEIINSISLNEDEFIASLRDPDIYAYALELGYNSFIMANKTIFQNEEDVIVGILQDANEQILALFDTINKSCLINYTCENPNCTMTLFTRDKGAILDLTNLLIIEEWGSVFNSCSSDRCFWACLVDWLGSPAGGICVAACGVVCGVSRAACVACFSVCAVWMIAECTDECNEDPCSHGHVCRPGTRMYIGCSGTARIYVLCRDDGMGWETTTHYAYCPSHHYCVPPGLCVPYPYPQVAAHVTTGLPLYDFMTVCFSSDGSVDYDGYITEYYWTFGDGYYSYERYPCHQFCPGYYTVTLRVTDNDGNRGFTNLHIYVYDDDTSPPVITIEPFGDATDSSPGYWDVHVSDPQSGLAEVAISVDGIYRGSSSGQYTIPNSLGPHGIIVYAKNNDKDKEGCYDDQ
ncbi:MAG: PKD domain-containing protein, partial [Promethearchaeota archaeon]